MRGKKILTTLALSALLFAGCGVKNTETAITVNGAAITKGAIDEAINAQIKNSPFTKMGIDIKNSQNDFLYLLTKDRVVNELIIKSLINEECNKRDITVTKDEQELAMEDLISKIGSKERFNEFLKQRGISKEQFNKDFNQELRIKKLAMQLDNTQVTEADAKKYYNANLKKFKFPDKVRASHILISTNPHKLPSPALQSCPNHTEPCHTAHYDNPRLSPSAIERLEHPHLHNENSSHKKGLPPDWQEYYSPPPASDNSWPPIMQ